MTNRIDLNGVWQLRWCSGQRGGSVQRSFNGIDSDRAFEATVPGEVHLDMMKAGLIGDPAVELNGLAARWVEEFLWFYRRTFNAPALAAGERAFLVLEAIDGGAIVYLNGQEVGRHANAFRPCRLEITKHLVAGENVLAIQADSGLYTHADKPASGYWASPDHQMMRRVWLRQCQSSFGWDWSERLLNVGLRGNVYVEIASAVRLATVVALAEVADDLARGTARVRVFAENLTDKPIAVTASAELRGPGLGAPVAASVTAEIAPGVQPVEVTLPIEGPQLWWPVGHGEQPLYEIKATLNAAGKKIGHGSRRVGFRHVRVNQSAHPVTGRYFIIEVNHKPIFCKGGNFVPADPITARIDRARYETLVGRALEANFNLLRIWGGGLYESDDLYEICDRRGVMLWQEFIFACAKYPGNDVAFLNDVVAEATHQVRRLANHASLVVWCGNNEMEWLAGEVKHQQGVAYSDFAIFHKALPTVLKAEDGTRYYQPSSPYSPDLAAPNANNVGDQHPWDIGFSDNDFRKYRAMVCRFPNEGGIMGPGALPTVRACMPKDQQRINSFAWEMHDNAIASWGNGRFTDGQTMLWAGKDLSKMSLEEYVYWSGIIQGEGIAEYVRNFRRRMFDCASAIFWMYNDCWPMVRSWTIVDYFLRRTPAFWPVRRAMAPLTVTVAMEDGKVKVFGVNEGPAWRGGVRFGVFALAGGFAIDRTQDVTLAANASTPLAEFDATELTSRDKTHGAFAVLSQDGRTVAQEKLFLPFWKEMTWPAARVTVRREGDKAIFESPTFAFRLCLDLDGERPLPDNFFDLLPGIPVTLDWPASLGEPKVLRVGNL